MSLNIIAMVDNNTPTTENSTPISQCAMNKEAHLINISSTAAWVALPDVSFSGNQTLHIISWKFN